jgi:hypothetical protein
MVGYEWCHGPVSPAPYVNLSGPVVEEEEYLACQGPASPVLPISALVEEDHCPVLSLLHNKYHAHFTIGQNLVHDKDFCAVVYHWTDRKETDTWMYIPLEVAENPAPLLTV